MDSAIAQRRQEDTDMTREAERSFHELLGEEFLFDRREREVRVTCLFTILSQGQLD